MLPLLSRTRSWHIPSRGKFLASGGLDTNMSLEMNPKHYQEYWTKGWTVVEGVFAAEEMDCVAELAYQITDRERASARPGYNVDFSQDGTQQAPRKLECPFAKHERFRELVLDPRLVGLIRSLLRHRPLLSGDQLFMKPPRFGSAKPYHQDNFYFQCFPADEVITAWIALDDADAGNGCLRYIDGSHLGPILPHHEIPGEPYNLVPPPELIDFSKESIAVVKKGGVVFHHVNTLHTSHRNDSDRWRKGYATHWVSANVTCQIETLNRAHFKKEEFKALFA